MRRTRSRFAWISVIATMAGLAAPDAVLAQCDVLGAYYRADKPFPQYYFHDIYRFLYASRFGTSEPLPTMAG